MCNTEDKMTACTRQSHVDSKANNASLAAAENVDDRPEYLPTPARSACRQQVSADHISCLRLSY